MKSHVLAAASLLLANACVGIVEDVATGGSGGGGNNPVATGAAGSDVITGTSGPNVTTTGATTSAAASTTVGSPTGTGSSITGGAGGSTGAIVSGTAGSGGTVDVGAGGGAASDDAGSARRDGGVAGLGGGTGTDASSGSTSEGGTVGATFTQVRAIVQRDCGNCHNFANYNTLTTHAVGRCGGDTLARANDPANTAFLELVQGQCGGFLMPRGCTKAPCISASDIQTFTSWIAAGAPNN